VAPEHLARQHGVRASSRNAALQKQRSWARNKNEKSRKLEYLPAVGAARDNKAVLRQSDSTRDGDLAPDAPEFKVPLFNLGVIENYFLCQRNESERESKRPAAVRSGECFANQGVPNALQTEEFAPESCKDLVFPRVMKRLIHEKQFDTGTNNCQMQSADTICEKQLCKLRHLQQACGEVDVQFFAREEFAGPAGIAVP
jgi:hypothetical protein